MFKKILTKNSDYFYFVFRVIIGITFLLHGYMKLPGILNGSTSMTSLMWYAGIIEIVAGVFIILGLFVTYSAFIAAIEMLVAFFYAHVAKSGTLNPLANKGEAALLFFAAFLILMTQGAKKWSLDKLFKR